MTETSTCVSSPDHNTDWKSNKEDKGGASDEDKENLIECLGECKWFSVVKGYGFVTPERKTGEEEQDVFVHKSIIQVSSGLPSLKPGEKIRFWYRPSDQGLKAVKVCGPSGEDCIGSPKRPHTRRGPARCYNCGEIGHHAKECNFPPLPKRCHHCKSVEHLVAQCPMVPTSGPSKTAEHVVTQSSMMTSSGQADALQSSAFSSVEDQ